MTSPLAPPRPAPQERAQPAPQGQAQTIATLAVLLAAGLGPTALATLALPLLARLGIGPKEGMQALALVVPHDLQVQAPGETANRVAAHEALYRARYLIAAGNRLKAGGTLDQERTYMQQHLAAQRARQEAAQKVDKAAERHGPVLGWYAILDNATDPICRQANGSNFSVEHPPKVGLPGSLHGGACRCRAGAPHPHASSVDAATGRVTRKAAEVIPFPVELTNAKRIRFERARRVLSQRHN